MYRTGGTIKPLYANSMHGVPCIVYLYRITDLDIVIVLLSIMNGILLLHDIGKLCKSQLSMTFWLMVHHDII